MEMHLLSKACDVQDVTASSVCIGSGSTTSDFLPLFKGYKFFGSSFNFMKKYWRYFKMDIFRIFVNSEVLHLCNVFLLERFCIYYSTFVVLSVFLIMPGMYPEGVLFWKCYLFPRDWCFNFHMSITPSGHITQSKWYNFSFYIRV